MKTRAAVYLRVSTEDQRERGTIETQRAHATEKTFRQPPTAW